MGGNVLFGFFGQLSTCLTGNFVEKTVGWLHRIVLLLYGMYVTAGMKCDFPVILCEKELPEKPEIRF